MGPLKEALLREPAGADGPAKPAGGGPPVLQKRRSELMSELNDVRERAMALESLMAVVEVHEELQRWATSIKQARKQLAVVDRDFKTQAALVGGGGHAASAVAKDLYHERNQLGDFEKAAAEPATAVALEAEGSLGREIAWLLTGAAPNEEVLKRCTWETRSKLTPYVAELRGRVERMREELGCLEEAIGRRHAAIREMKQEAIDKSRGATCRPPASPVAVPTAPSAPRGPRPSSAPSARRPVHAAATTPTSSPRSSASTTPRPQSARPSGRRGQMMAGGGGDDDPFSSSPRGGSTRIFGSAVKGRLLPPHRLIR